MTTTIEPPIAKRQVAAFHALATPLESLDRYAGSVDEFIRLAHAYSHVRADVVAHVARTRNLTPDHAEGVVKRRWPSPATAYDQIYLADNEWGSPLMKQIAAQWFETHPTCNFVSVYEHAGWSLTFTRENLECVGSANDQAMFRFGIPRPTHYSGVSERRAVKRPDLKEVTDLIEYEIPTRQIEILEPFVQSMADELGIPREEMPV
jgi:hypothetical protein